MPEDVLFVETDAAKTSVFQLGKREVMERVFDVIELVFGELLAAAKGARVERIRGGRFGVHIFISCARVRRSPLRCFSQNQRAKRGSCLGKRERETIKVLSPLFLLGKTGAKNRMSAVSVSGNHQSSHIGRLRKTENKILVMIVNSHRGRSAPGSHSLFTLSSLSLFSPREKTKVRYNTHKHARINKHTQKNVRASQRARDERGRGKRVLRRRARSDGMDGRRVSRERFQLRAFRHAGDSGRASEARNHPIWTRAFV